MRYTPIPDQEAATILRMSKNTIRNAVMRGDLTRVPMAGQLQHVAREQVVLFEDMKQVRKGLLTREKQASWEEIERSINNPTQNTLSGTPAYTENAPITINLDRSALEYLDERKRTIQANTPAGPMSFHSALTDEQFANAQRNAIAMTLLLGLAVVFIGKVINNEQARAIGQAFMDRAEVACQELLTAEAQHKIVKAVQNYPEYAKEVYNALKEAGAIAA